MDTPTERRSGGGRRAHVAGRILAWVAVVRRDVVVLALVAVSVGPEVPALPGARRPLGLDVADDPDRLDRLLPQGRRRQGEGRRRHRLRQARARRTSGSRTASSRSRTARRAATSRRRATRTARRTTGAFLPSAPAGWRAFHVAGARLHPRRPAVGPRTAAAADHPGAPARLRSRSTRSGGNADRRRSVDACQAPCGGRSARPAARPRGARRLVAGSCGSTFALFNGETQNAELRVRRRLDRPADRGSPRPTAGYDVGLDWTVGSPLRTTQQAVGRRQRDDARHACNALSIPRTRRSPASQTTRRRPTPTPNRATAHQRTLVLLRAAWQLDDVPDVAERDDAARAGGHGGDRGRDRRTAARRARSRRATRSRSRAISARTCGSGRPHRMRVHRRDDPDRRHRQREQVPRLDGRLRRSRKIVTASSSARRADQVPLVDGRLDDTSRRSRRRSRSPGRQNRRPRRRRPRRWTLDAVVERSVEHRQRRMSALERDELHADDGRRTSEPGAGCRAPDSEPT